VVLSMQFILTCVKGIHSIIGYHGNSVARALIDTFPEIGLEKSKFDLCIQSLMLAFVPFNLLFFYLFIYF
jgi:hypothetical protein